MFPRFHSSLAQFRNTFRHRRRPARLTLGVAAATVAAAVGLSLGGGTPAVSHSGALVPAAASGAARGAASGAASGVALSAAARHAAAVRQHQAAAALASSQRARQSGSGQHPASPASPAPRRHRHAVVAPPTPAQPFLIYDSVTPSAIPGKPVIATYADGPHPDSPSELAGRGPVLWIDINGSDPQASALDIEPGCAAPSEAASWVSRRLSADPSGVAILYTMISQWSAVQANVGSLPSWMQAHIRWWIADPTGSPHLVPGSQATQWYWGQNYDISTAVPGF